MEQEKDTSTLPPAEWIELIRLGEEDFAAGRTMPAADLLVELRARNEHMAARLAKKASDAA